MGRQRDDEALTRIAVSEQLYERLLEVAGGSKLRARMLFERAAHEAMQAECARRAAQARAGNSRLMNPRRRFGMVWR